MQTLMQRVQFLQTGPVSYPKFETNLEGRYSCKKTRRMQETVVATPDAVVEEVNGDKEVDVIFARFEFTS